MPYPPPPGPPDVGEFQAIGKLPAPELPDVTGHGGEFLETDGIVPQWQPVSGVLPDPTGHAGEFLTTPDGVTVAWAPGGGGGGGVTTVGPLTTATANAATIVGATLSLAPADATNPGVLNTARQAIGGFKHFQAGAAFKVYDVANYGGVPNDNTNDLSLAFTATQLAASGDGQSSAEYHIGTGDWYISYPLCLPVVPTTLTAKLTGDGKRLTRIHPGPGTSATPSLVQGFCGPMIYSDVQGPPVRSPVTPTPLPVYAAPLVGVVGQSLTVTFDMMYMLHDAWAWTIALNHLSSFTVRFNVNIADLGPYGGGGQVIGSRGPGSDGANDIAWGIYTVPAGGGNFTFKAYLTTQQSPQQSITSTSCSTGTTYNIELCYDGSHFDLWVDGVSQGPVVATGVVFQTPWEAVSIGFSGPEFSFVNINGNNCDIFSIELSDIARHTGTSSFTPPTSAYVADAHTLALINLDQGSLPAGIANAPFVIGQSDNGRGVLIRHFIRFINGYWGETFGDAGAVLEMSDFYLDGASLCSGIVCYETSQTNLRDIVMVFLTKYGLCSWDPGSFFNTISDITIYACSGTGVLYYGEMTNIVTFLCRIGQQVLSASMRNCNDQPGGASVGPPYWQDYSSLYPFVWGPASQGSNSYISAESCGIDAEGAFPTMRSGVGVFNMGTILSRNCIWNSTGGTYDKQGRNGVGPPSPSIHYFVRSPGATHIGDNFNPAIGAAGALTKGIYYDGRLTLKNCTNNGLDRVVVTPWTDSEGWLILESQGQANNRVGISVSDVQANNIYGTFHAIFGTSTCYVNFFEPEPDGNFNLWFQCVGAVGGTPAAGSTDVVSFTTNSDGSGFVATLGADPGGSVILTFSYLLIRVEPPPLLTVATPSIPSTVTNPLVTASPTGDFAIGITVIPINGTNFVYNYSNVSEVIMQWGTPSADWCQIGLVRSCGWDIEYNVAIGFAGLPVDSFVYRGKLYGILNPGTHNIVAVKRAGYWDPLMDGGHLPAPMPVPNLTGTQQTPIYIGEDSSSSQALVSATLRNLKIDKLASRAATSEPDYGPRGMLQAAFFGDSFTAGSLSATASGGFASQIAAARYGTTYYWIAAGIRLRLVDMMAERATLAGGEPFWGAWGSSYMSHFTGVCVMAGFYDLLYDGASAADVLDNLKGFFEGTRAVAYFTPPTSGTATCVINGVSFTATFSVNADTTVNNLIALINASGPTTALVTPTLVTHQLKLTAVTRGTGGNGITVSSNNANQAFFDRAATSGAVDGLLSLVSPPVMVLCNVPPFGNSGSYTAGKETQRTTLNAAIAAYIVANPSITAADVDGTLADPGAPQNILAAYLAGDSETLTDAGHTALYGLINPLLP